MQRRERRVLGVVFLAVLVPLAGGSPAWAQEPFDYFRNSWSVVGLKDYRAGARITPDNKIQLAGNVITLRFGRDLAALSRRQTKRLMDGWLPVVLVSASDGAVRYDFTLWATPLPNVKDWQAAFDWPTEGENFLVWVQARAANGGAEAAEAKVAVQPGKSAGSPPEILTWPLAPGQSAEGVVRLPFTPDAAATGFDKEDARLWLERTAAFWRDLLAKGARIQVPCEKAASALLAAHVCQLIANDRGELHAGEGFYDEFYIRDGAYQVMELEEAGLTDVSRKALEFYLAAQRPDGRFETQKNQFDANGQAIWTLWQFHKITGDRAWLERAYPQMRKAADWVRRARRQAPADSAWAGLLPPAPADGENLWDGKHHIVGYDLWNLRGMLCTADAAAILGRKDDAELLTREAAEYRAAIEAAWKKTGLAHFPPSWEKDGTHWGDTETLWPTELFPPDDPRVAASLDEVRRRFGGGFAEGAIRWTGQPDVIHPYMSAYTTMASLTRGEHEQVVEDFYWYLLHSTAAHAFPEGIYYKRRVAWSDTIPHATGAGNFAIMLRHMLVHEQAGELHLLRAVPDGWLSDGRQIRVERAPTHFGEMGLVVTGQTDGVQVELRKPMREKPRRIVLHLPRSRPLVGKLDGVEVVAREDQKKRWDFPTVVELYQEQAGDLMKAIPGLVPLPLSANLAADQCRLLDLAAAANTDPFTAPFGVPKPGKHLFTGMPVGEQVVAGVPFRIIDPARNNRRALVVLHSPQAPADIVWPRQVEIPVGAKGKRLFFLGNVHGWAPQDAGTGEWGAVAQYAIHYADGQKQIVPLITGRTADDWASPPEADEVFVGLKGDPWHLGVLGVQLRPVEVEKIVFEDLGTPAAPVLAAVTMEK